jgi:hypothetical protein
MANAYYKDIQRGAQAKVFTASAKSEGLTGLPTTDFETAEEAFAAAVAARDSGEHAMVRAWVEGAGMVDFPLIQEVHEYWTQNPE